MLMDSGNTRRDVRRHVKDFFHLYQKSIILISIKIYLYLSNMLRSTWFTKYINFIYILLGCNNDILTIKFVTSVKHVQFVILSQLE